MKNGVKIVKLRKVAKNRGKMVYLTAPLDEITYSSGYKLPSSAKKKLNQCRIEVIE